MFTTDNRWSPGASGANVPEDAVVAYSARWIDRGDLVSADIVPDRQGFAYNDSADMVPLIDRLTFVDAQSRHCELNYDVIETLYDGTEDDAFALVMRRTGGYVYVDAWIEQPF
jgi:hypothetical protein